FKIYEVGSKPRIFAHEQRKDVSNFPWWNHWPVAMIPSDGRYCQATDRASHFSLAWGGVNPNKGDGDFYWWAIMYGATDRPATELVNLDRSWNSPPALKVLTELYKNNGYDKAQRCYNLVNLTKNKPEKLGFLIESTEDSPIQNLSLVINDWGTSDFEVYVNSLKKEFKKGYINKVDTKDLVLWLEVETEDVLEIEIKPL
ncbi:MAG: hypothetical protein R3250_02885, partial [Melioribacteraceae bacterium]|nr:hypothetical protein [Melioribacteraceae bacterium]